MGKYDGNTIFHWDQRVPETTMEGGFYYLPQFQVSMDSSFNKILRFPFNFKTLILGKVSFLVKKAWPEVFPLVLVPDVISNNCHNIFHAFAECFHMYPVQDHSIEALKKVQANAVTYKTNRLGQQQ